FDFPNDDRIVVFIKQTYRYISSCDGVQGNRLHPFMKTIFSLERTTLQSNVAPFLQARHLYLEELRLCARSVFDNLRFLGKPRYFRKRKIIVTVCFPFYIEMEFG